MRSVSLSVSRTVSLVVAASINENVFVCRLTTRCTELPDALVLKEFSAYLGQY